jgi:crotonobetainyl-CoA hydratase
MTTAAQAPSAKVIVERVDHTMVITLNRPEARNAVDGEMCDLVGGALDAAQADAQVWVVVLTGAGDKAFCAGADLKAIARGERTMAEGENEQWSFAGFAHHPIDKPTIAAVNGTALGGGLELALACDLVVVERHAQFGLPEVKRGLIAGAGGAFRIMDQLPRKLAAELLFTGRPFTADQAHAWGLVNQVVRTGGARDAALELAAEINANAPLAVQSSKRLALGLMGGVVTGEVAAWEQNAAENAYILTTEDAREGPHAFAEKRSPNWLAR